MDTSDEPRNTGADLQDAIRSIHAIGEDETGEKNAASDSERRPAAADPAADADADEAAE